MPAIVNHQLGTGALYISRLTLTSTPQGRPRCCCCSVRIRRIWGVEGCSPVAEQGSQPILPPLCSSDLSTLPPRQLQEGKNSRWVSKVIKGKRLAFRECSSFGKRVEAAVSAIRVNFPGCWEGGHFVRSVSPNSESPERWRLLVRLLTDKKSFYAICTFSC